MPRPAAREQRRRRRHQQSSQVDMKGALEQSFSFKLKACIRRASDSIDKRFCFDVVPEERNEVFTLQALSDEDRRQWLDAMDGREPVYSPSGTSSSENLLQKMRTNGSPLASSKQMNARSFSWTTASPRKMILEDMANGHITADQPYNIARGLRSIFQASAFLPAFVIDGDYAMLDESGFEFIKQCIAIIEEKGIREQGIYRNCGVTSKVQKLMQLALDKRKNSSINSGDRLNLSDEEWEIRTISSAIKTFLRNLPEPLMTFELHNHFINAAKIADVQQRVNHIHYYVYQLPESHRLMLDIIIRHLRRVADLSAENLMTVGNLGVCFGPSLLRPKEETMAAIMDIKFCNVVVEMLIANCHRIFDTKPPQQVVHPCPPKPTLSAMVAVMPNETTKHKPSAAQIASESSVGSSGGSLATSIGEISFNNGGEGAFQRPVDAQSIISPAIIPPARPGISPRPKSMAVSSSSSPINSAAVAASAAESGSVAVRHRKPPPVSVATAIATFSGLNGQLPHQQMQQHHHTNLTSHNENFNRLDDNSNYMGSTCSSSGGRCPSSHSGQPLNGASPSHRPSIERNATILATTADASNNSSESLNSIGSLNDCSPGTHSVSSSGGGGSGVAVVPLAISPVHPTTALKAKLAGPYAPAYNPQACENLSNRLQKRHSGWDLTASFSVNSNPASGIGQQMVSEYASTVLITNPSQQTAGGHVSSQQQQFHTIHKIPPAYSSLISPNAQPQPRRVRTLYHCLAGHETELTFEPNQIITNVYDSKEEGWLVGTLNGKTGLIPANYVFTI